MFNEIQEFLDYTTPVTSIVKAKADTTYLRHFTLDFFTSFNGLNRVLTILARGYLYSNLRLVQFAILRWNHTFGFPEYLCEIADILKSAPGGNIGDFFLC